MNKRSFVESPVFMALMCLAVADIPTISELAFLPIYAGLWLAVGYYSTKYTVSTLKEMGDKGSVVLEEFNQLKPFNFNIPGPMMVCLAAPHGHESKAQRGLIRYSDNESDDDEADHDSGLYQLDQSTHEDKSAWERVLMKYQELSARLDKLEESQ